MVGLNHAACKIRASSAAESLSARDNPEPLSMTNSAALIPLAINHCLMTAAPASLLAG
jgi:hypothetical protein